MDVSVVTPHETKLLRKVFSLSASSEVLGIAPDRIHGAHRDAKG